MNFTPAMSAYKHSRVLILSLSCLTGFFSPQPGRRLYLEFPYSFQTLGPVHFRPPPRGRSLHFARAKALEDLGCTTRFWDMFYCTSTVWKPNPDRKSTRLNSSHLGI